MYGKHYLLTLLLKVRGIFMDIKEMIQKHGEQMLKIAFFITKDKARAEEVVHHVFAELEKKKKLLNDEELFQLTAANAKGKRSLFRKTSEELHFEDKRFQLAEAVLNLPLKYREALVYYYYFEWPLIRIANQMRTSMFDVQKTIKQAQEMVKESFPASVWEVKYRESFKE